MSFPQHTLDYVLVSLKIIGIIGAFIGLSAAESARKPEGAGESAKPKRRSIYGFIFLFIAVGAEICDSSLKLREEEEQAEYFNRLAHPLGTIRGDIFYRISLKDPTLKSYSARIEQQGLVEPHRTTEARALALLEGAPEVTISIYKRPQKNLGISKNLPDLSFGVDAWNKYGRIPENNRINFKSVVDSRHYQYIGKNFPVVSSDSGEYPIGTIEANLAYENRLEDRYSNGAIVSDLDLLGATIGIKFCPLILVLKPSWNPIMSEFEEADSTFSKLVTLQSIRIEFPGRQTLYLGPRARTEFTKTSIGTDDCTYFSFDLPKDEATYHELLQR